MNFLNHNSHKRAKSVKLSLLLTKFEKKIQSVTVVHHPKLMHNYIMQSNFYIELSVILIRLIIV